MWCICLNGRIWKKHIEFFHMYVLVYKYTEHSKDTSTLANKLLDIQWRHAHCHMNFDIIECMSQISKQTDKSQHYHHQQQEENKQSTKQTENVEKKRREIRKRDGERERTTEPTNNSSNSSKVYLWTFMMNGTMNIHGQWFCPSLGQNASICTILL